MTTDTPVTFSPFGEVARSNGPTPSTPYRVSICDACSAVVVDRADHARWHAEAGR